MIPDVRVATGFYTNWDSFIKVDEKVLDWIKKGGKAKPKTGQVVLDSLEEALYTLEEALRYGGKEFLISKEVYDELNSFFSSRERRLGGNGCNMGRTLYELGLNPLVSYPCRPVKLMLKSPDFKVACKDGFRTPKQANRVEDPEYDHLIFEFKEDQQKEIYVSGRHILSWDLMSFYGMFDEDFFVYAFNQKYTDILIFGYAHLLLPSHKEKTREIADRLEEGRRPKVHFEFGQGSEESLRYAMKIFADKQCTDSWGLNEKECVQYFFAESEKLEDLEESVLEAIKKYGLNRICVHTPNFAFSIFRRGDPRREMEALRRGCLITAALTMGGIKENLVSGINLPKTEVEAKTEKIEAGYTLCLVPAYSNPNPKVLTGLGDAFSAVQAVISLA